MVSLSDIQRIIYVLITTNLPYCVISDNDGHIYMNQDINLTLKTCNFTGSFSLNSGVSLRHCVKDCHLRSSCSYVIYRSVNGICALTNTEVNFDLLDDVFPVCVYTKPSDWNVSGLGKCSTNSCTGNTICNPVSSTDSQTCTASECPEPPTIDHARFQPLTRNVGSKVAYFCDHGYTPRGNTSIICLHTGLWTSTDFNCATTCPRPLTVDNADILDVSTGDYGNGSVLFIECKAGYLNNKSTNITSTCKSDGDWSDKVIPCCKQGYSFSWHSKGRSCYIIHEDVQLNSTTEMSRYCQNESSTSSLFFTRSIKNNLQVTENIFQTNNLTINYVMTSLTKSSMKNDLLKCIDKSEVQINKHNQVRKDNVISLLTGSYSELNTTGLSYDNMSGTLQEVNVASWNQHEEFRLDDIITRLNLTCGFTVPPNSSYDQLYEELQDKTIDSADFESKTYTELAHFIGNNSGSVPSCDNLDYWYPGYPNSEEDCIMTGPPSNFTLIETPCNITDTTLATQIGYICWETKRTIQ